MSTKRKTYNADFKAKLVLEVLEGEKAINEIASKYEVLPVNLKNWKKQFWSGNLNSYSFFLIPKQLFHIVT